MCSPARACSRVPSLAPSSAPTSRQLEASSQRHETRNPDLIRPKTRTLQKRALGPATGLSDFPVRGSSASKVPFSSGWLTISAPSNELRTSNSTISRSCGAYRKYRHMLTYLRADIPAKLRASALVLRPPPDIVTIPIIRWTWALPDMTQAQVD